MTPSFPSFLYVVSMPIVVKIIMRRDTIPKFSGGWAAKEEVFCVFFILLTKVAPKRSMKGSFHQISTGGDLVEKYVP